MWYANIWQWAKEHLIVTVPGVVLVFSAAWVLMLAVQSGTAGAAWVQALGSVGAILVAIWVAERSHRRDREREAFNMLLEEVRCAWIADCAVCEMQAALAVIEEQVGSNVVKPSGVHATQISQSAELLQMLLQQKIPHRMVTEIFKVNAIALVIQEDLKSWAAESPYSQLVPKPGTLKKQAIGEYRLAVRKAWLLIYSEYSRLAGEAGLPFTQRIFQ